MTDETKLFSHLRELIEALDRRAPQLERENETRIADDAAALRQRAQERIAQLRGASSMPASDEVPKDPSLVEDDAQE